MLTPFFIHSKKGDMMKNYELMFRENFVEDTIHSVCGNSFREKRKTWAGTPFKDLAVIGTSKNLGMFGEHLIEHIYTNMQKTIHPARRGYDLMANRKRVEIKTSFIGQDNKHTICQIRPHSGFTRMVIVFVTPTSINIYQAKKEDILVAVEKGSLKFSHRDGKKGAKLYLIHGTQESIKTALNLRNISNLMSRYYSDTDLRRIASDIVHNRLEANQHMQESIFEELAFSGSSKIGKFGREIFSYLNNEYGLNGKVKVRTGNVDRDGDDVYVVRTSRCDAEGKFTINQVRPKDDYDYMMFIAIQPDDIQVYRCHRSDVMKATRNMTQQHDNGEQKRPDLYGMVAPIEHITETFNLIEL